LAEKISFLILNPQIANMLGKNGRRFVESNLTIDRMVAETQDVYAELLNSEKSIAVDHQ
jgi:glycosyltransferase involved in cell wall biosynthesis